MPIQNLFFDCEDYVCTEEDEINNCLENEWKRQRNLDAVKEFLRCHPSGLPVPLEN